MYLLICWMLSGMTQNMQSFVIKFKAVKVITLKVNLDPGSRKETVKFTPDSIECYTFINM